jgi:hypothetical protein
MPAKEEMKRCEAGPWLESESGAACWNVMDEEGIQGRDGGERRAFADASCMLRMTVIESRTSE